MIRQFKKPIVIVILGLIVTDIAIFLDIPMLREVLGFVYFSTVPGVLILHILKLNSLDFVKKLLLSVGLSLSFLIFIGLLINFLFPLTTISLVLPFSIILLLLCAFAYRRNKEGFSSPLSFNRQTDSQKQLTFMLILPVLWPLLAVLGTQLMNTTNNNAVLVVTLISIPIYIVAVVLLRQRIPNATYPVAIGMISISLLLIWGLTSNYLIGRDSHDEYFVSQLTVSIMHWSPANIINQLNATLSVSLLPPIYHLITGVHIVYFYKVMLPLLVSLTPLAIYRLSEKYLGSQYAFLAAFFFMAQAPFMNMIFGATRQVMAIFFFALAMMTLFDDRMSELNKRMILLIFVFAVIVSHYSTSYILFFLLLIVWISGTIGRKFARPKLATGISGSLVALSFACIFLWYAQITELGFPTAVNMVQRIFANLWNIFAVEMAAPSVQAAFGIGVSGIGRWIRVIVSDITFVLIAIGALSLIIKPKRLNLDTDYTVMVLTSLGMMAALAIIPLISWVYTGGRFYAQLLVFLAPMYVLGGVILFRFIKPRLGLVFITVVVILQFLSSSYLVDQALGVPTSIYLNRAGYWYSTEYTYESEVTAAEWLEKYGKRDLTIHGDIFGYLRLYQAQIWAPRIDKHFFTRGKPAESGYIYLRRANVLYRKVYIGSFQAGEMAEDINDYSYLIEGKNKIYSNGTSEILKVEEPAASQR